MAVSLPMPLYALLPLCGVAALCVYTLSCFFHQLFVTPIRKFPGPRHWALSEVFYIRMVLSGEGHHRMLELHQKYGPIVRVGPYHVSVNHPDGMKEVRGHRKTGENGKDNVVVAINGDNIIGANRADHQLFRRALSHAFSAQAMIEQQPIIRKYVDTLFQKLKVECADGQRPLNIEKWLNFTTFDIIGDLAFGEPFGCLENDAYHPWVSIVFQSIKSMAYVASFKRVPLLTPLLGLFIPRGLIRDLKDHKELSREKVRKRLDLDHSRPDFMESMLRKSEKAGRPMTFEELSSNSAMLIVAGSETTATLLTGATYYLGTNPDKLAKLVEEVRGAFKSEEEIDMLSVQNLKYLLAVLEETSRIYPPVPGPSPRTIGEEGDNILGEFFPAGASVDVWQWTVYNNPAHFARPTEFIPERWTDDPRFANDAKQALQPFSIGPRNCIGKNLAYAEMRLILARLVWNFDIRIAEDTLGWPERSKVYILWQKGPANVYLTPRQSVKA